jgi:transketolase
MQGTENIRERAINTIRFLSADAVQKANSGHPGLPMGNAAVAYTLWTCQMRYNPRNPHWPGRDRFLLSGGHGSMLLYSMLHLTGYDLSLEDIQNFRQWDSRTPGHPESFLTPGIEVTTGPLGQGFANGVGMAIAAEHMRALFNRPGHEIIDGYVYAIVTDGDLMEGVSSEAASLAGHLQLSRLIYLYDDNRISIDGSTDLAFTEDRGERFEAYGWQVLRVDDGNDVDAIDRAVTEAKADPRPSLIICRTTIGYGLPHKAGTAEAHGEPPGDDELNGAKLALGWPLEPRFLVPPDVHEHYRQMLERGRELESAWNERLNEYRKAFPDLGEELGRRLFGAARQGWDQNLPVFPPDPKGMATRISSGKVINALAKNLPELIGGSADLTPSTKTSIDASPDFQPGCYEGRNLHFGVREHAMGSAVNGMAHYGTVIPFGATFLVFSDYMRPAIRLAALSRTGSIFVFTHDSVGLGEDGPTHQPVEHYAALRAIPRLHVIRPADANEVTEACTKARISWRTWVTRRPS